MSPIRRRGQAAAPLLLEGFVVLRIEGRLHHAADGVGTAAVVIGKGLGALAAAEASHQLLFLAVAEPGGRHGQAFARLPTLGGCPLTLSKTVPPAPPHRRWHNAFNAPLAQLDRAAAF